MTRQLLDTFDAEPDSPPPAATGALPPVGAAPAGSEPPAAAVPRRRSRLVAVVNGVGLVLGVGLLVALVARLDAHAVAAQLRQAGWCFLGAFACYALNQAVTTAAWQQAIAPGASRARYLELLAVFQVGHALNAVTPGSSLGDVLRGTLLRDRVRGDALVASLVNHHYFLTSAMAWANVVGAALCVLFLPLPSRVIGVVFGLAVAFLLPIVALAVLLRHGAAALVVRLLRRLPFVRLRDPAALLAQARRVDESIRGLRRDHPERFRRIVLWLVWSRVFQVAELWVLLLGLLPGHHPAWLALLALLTETANQLLAWALTIVPGQVGVAEGNASLLYGLLGLNPVVGLSLALLRRSRMIIGVVIGLVIGWWLGVRPRRKGA